MLIPLVSAVDEIDPCFSNCSSHTPDEELGTKYKRLNDFKESECRACLHTNYTAIFKFFVCCLLAVEPLENYLTFLCFCFRIYKIRIETIS